MPNFPKSKGLDPLIWTEAKAGQIDAPVSETATPADILVDPATDKIDGSRIDQILAGVAPIEGTCEPAVIDEVTEVVLQELGVLFYLEGHIDLSALVVDDVITLSESISLVTPVDYKEYGASDYSGVQDLPLLFVETKPGLHGVKLELTQTAGVLKTFPYQFFVKRVA